MHTDRWEVIDGSSRLFAAGDATLCCILSGAENFFESHDGQPR